MAARIHQYSGARRRTRLLCAGLAAVATSVAACGPTAQPEPSAADFRGLVQFTGAPQPDNPYIVGGIIYLDWATAEPAEGSYDWAAIDDQLALWASRGKRAAIRVQTAVPGRSASPAWLYALDVPHVDWSDGSVMPVFWNQTYLSEWTTFVQAVADRYDGDARVLWYQTAIGVDGESKVDIPHDGIDPLPRWVSVGYTDRMWWSTLTTLAMVGARAFAHTPVAVSVDRSFIGGTPGYNENRVVDWLVQHSLWPQDDGLVGTTTYPDASWRSNHLAEQLLSTSRTGDNLADDINAGLRTHATYIILYGTDLADPVYQSTLAAAAGKAVPLSSSAS